jgi:hypothetical protein
MPKIFHARLVNKITFAIQVGVWLPQIKAVNGLTWLLIPHNMILIVILPLRLLTKAGQGLVEVTGAEL